MPTRLPVVRMRRVLLGALFFAIFSIISLAFLRLQNSIDFPHLAPDIMTESDRDRLYVDRYTDLSKWLIALSYALLVGVATKRRGDKEDPLFRSVSFSVGVGLLLLSLYAGFLSYQSVLIVLSSKPLWMLRSRLTSFPVAAQLWLLSGATVFLAVAFFRADNSKEGTASSHLDVASSSPSEDKIIPSHSESTATLQGATENGRSPAD